MAILGLRRPLKPRNGVLDGNSPLANGLVFDMMNPLRAIDLAGNLTAVKLGTTPTLDYYGQVASFPGTTDNIGFTTPTGSKFNSMTKFSYEAMFYATGLGGGSLGYVFSKGAINHNFFVQIKTGPVLNVFANYSTSDGTWSTPIALNQWYHMVVTKDYGTPSAAPIVYLDGIPATLTVGDVAAGTTLSDDTDFVIGNSVKTGGTRNWAGMISHVRAWNRILSPSEVKMLNVNPWCLYLPSGDIDQLGP